MAVTDQERFGGLLPSEKAHALNFRGKVFGAFAEIGAGQEVARVFFHVGRSASTIAKSMSAYGMMVSDDIYLSRNGDQFKHSFRISYTSRYRLLAMLNHEQTLMLDRFVTKADRQAMEGRRRLEEDRNGLFPCLFSYANTFATGDSPYGSRGAHSGWMGVRIQSRPSKNFQAHDDQIGWHVDLIAHVVLLEQDRKGQYETIGSMGVNLIAAAYEHLTDPESAISESELVRSLFDGISKWKVRMDVLEINPSLAIRNAHKDFNPDNRNLSLQVVQESLSYDTLICRHHSPSHGEISGNRFLKDAPIWVRTLKDWHSTKASQSEGRFADWAYPEDDVREPARYFTNREVHLIKAYVRSDAKGHYEIGVRGGVDEWLSKTADDGKLPVFVLPIDDLPKMSDGERIDFKAFERASQMWSNGCESSALLITHTSDLAWTIESVRRSLGEDAPGRSRPSFSLQLDRQDWSEIFDIDFDGRRQNVVERMKRHEGSGQELMRDWAHMSSCLLDFLTKD